MPWAFVELRLCRDVYHCLPSQLDDESWERIRSHLAVMEGEAQAK